MEDDEDGEFYMDFTEDFLKYFGGVEIVHKNPGDLTLDNRDDYEVMTFFGAWEGESAGGSSSDRGQLFKK